MAADGAGLVLVVTANVEPISMQFVVDNAATADFYTTDWQSHPPTSKAKGIIAGQKYLVQVGPNAWAFGIVQAPDILVKGPDGTYPDYTQPIHVSALLDGVYPLSATIPIVPPPVFLLHGLWGKSDSLSEVETYLSGQAPYSSLPVNLFFQRQRTTAPWRSTLPR